MWMWTCVTGGYRAAKCMDDDWWQEEFRAAIEQGIDPPHADDVFQALRARINLVCVVSPDLGYAELGCAGMKAFLAATFTGDETRGEAEGKDLVQALVEFVGETKIGWLAEIAPERFELENGPKLKLRYSTDTDPDRGEASAPEADVRIHQMLDCSEHPFVGEGLVAVNLCLRDPKGNRVDHTFDWPRWKREELPVHMDRLRDKFPAEFGSA